MRIQHIFNIPDLALPKLEFGPAVRLTALVGFLLGWVALPALAAPVTHPNLFLNRAEIEQVKAKIAKYPWAEAALVKTKEDALTNNAFAGNSVLDQALYFTFAGDTNFADRARGAL